MSNTRTDPVIIIIFCGTLAAPMDAKTLNTLEYPKILERLAAYCAFAASADKARALRPSDDLVEVQQRQARTREALQMLATRPDLTIGGARDIRASIDMARHGAVLLPSDLLDVKYTLIAGRSLIRTFERLESQFPQLYQIAINLPIPAGLVDAVSRAISDRGDILDTASPKLAVIRRDLRIAHDRLMSRLQRMVSDPKNTPYLQEALITQRDGRYVLPLRAEFKGRIKSIVHDQSSSGATLFIEPLAVVELNNQYRELQLAERDEERRILAELSMQVGRSADDLLLALDCIAELDVCFASAKYADDLSATEPVMVAFRKMSHSRHPGSVIRVVQARHPLLDAGSVVPIDMELDDQTYGLVVTGPNTGGKTVTLKTIGLLCLMAQSGLHIPAHSGSELSIFDDIYADIGDEQSIEQSLSTFSGHITNIIHILENADRRSLVILDELGAGTDPQEGAALARALLTHLMDRSITTLVTTHHPELKAYAHATPGVVNASVEFDLETLRPTYRLTLGIPGRSNALAIAQRLGMPSAIITDARSELNPTDLRAEDLLDEIHHQRELSRQARQAAEKARTEAEKLQRELAQRLEAIEDERRSLLETARRQAQERLEDVERDTQRLRKELARARQPLEAIQAVEEKVEVAQERVETPEERRRPAIPGVPLRRAIRLGDKVRLRNLNAQGVVSSLGEEEAEVQVGVLRVRARLSELELASAPAAVQQTAPTSAAKSPAPKHSAVQPAQQQTTGGIEFSPSPGIELDLRGMRADDAWDALDRYLDSAFAAGLPWVRIIHGKGTGKLRLMVREALQQNPYVRSFQSGGEKEGGDGVTVASMRAS